MKTSLLSTCMIVRNEEDCLERCLASIRPFTDELILVDTGSTDGTLAIAERYADRVIHHPWEDNFSAARNRSIVDAGGEWIFYIDADEELLPGEGENLRQALSAFSEGVDHLQLMIRNLNGAGGILSEFQALRLFRNRRGIRFGGIVHNQVICRGQGGEIPVTLHHYGYALAPEKMEKKFQRTLALTHKQIAEEPENPLYHHNLTLSLVHHHDHAEAVECGLKGLRLFEKSSPPYPPIFSNLIYLTARAALAAGDADLASRVCREGLKVRPEHLDLFWVLSMSSFHRKHYEETLEWSTQFRQAVDTYRQRPASDVPVNTIGQIAPLLITAGYAAAYLGREQEAHRFMEEGLSEGGWDPETGIKTLHFCRSHPLTTPGTPLLQALLRRHPDHAELRRFLADFPLPVESARTPSEVFSIPAPRKTLIINLCELGDLIQATPLIEEIVAKRDSVTLLVRKDHLEAARHLPDVAQVVPFDPSRLGENNRKREECDPLEEAIRHQIGELLREPFDLLLNMTHTPLGAGIAKRVSAREKMGLLPREDGSLRIEGPSIRYLKQMLAHRDLNNLHVVDLHRLLLPEPLERRELSFRISEQEWAEAMEILRIEGITPETPLIGIQPGAREVRKRWPEESFTRLAKEIAAERQEILLLFGVESEGPLADIIVAAAPGRIVNLTGKTGIGALAALLSRCRLLISNDTGTSHLAAATGTKVLSLHMGHVWFRETSPYGEGHVAMQARCKCCPCSQRTPCENLDCRKILTPVAVYHILQYMLDGAPLPDDESFREIEVEESHFDDRNFLIHRPLQPGPTTLENYLRDAYGQLWKDRLTGAGGSPGNLSDPCRIPEGEEVDLFYADLTLLRERIEEARVLATGLARTSREGKEISQGARRFKELHHAILALGRQNPLLRPLTEFYDIEQQQIEAKEFPAVMQSFAAVLENGCNLLKKLEERLPLSLHAGSRSKSGK